MKKIVRLTESQLHNVIKRIVKENNINKTSIDEQHNEEYGNVTIQITGNGHIKHAVVNRIREALKLLQGERHIFVDGKEINPYRENESKWGI